MSPFLTGEEMGTCRQSAGAFSGSAENRSGNPNGLRSTATISANGMEPPLSSRSPITAVFPETARQVTDPSIDTKFVGLQQLTNPCPDGFVPLGSLVALKSKKYAIELASMKVSPTPEAESLSGVCAAPT